MRMTLDLPDSILRALETKAAEQGFELKDLAERYIVQGLRSETPSSGLPNRICSPLPVFRKTGGESTQGFSNEKLQEILDDEEVDQLSRSLDRFPASGDGIDWNIPKIDGGGIKVSPERLKESSDEDIRSLPSED